MPRWRPRWFIPIALGFVTSLACAQALHGESPQAREALDRAVEFMGGARVVYGMRTLVLASNNTRHHDGRDVAVPTRTYYAFPLGVRQEVTLNGRRVAMASSPAGGTLFTTEGDSPLDHATRLGVERSAMRNPVVLLKSRVGRGFGAQFEGTETIEGETVDRLRLNQHDNETLLLLARADGRPVEVRYGLRAADARKRAIRVRFADWKTSSSGLRYPHVARGHENDSQVFVVATDHLDVDVPLSETLFSSENEPASVGLRPGR